MVVVVLSAGIMKRGTHCKDNKAPPPPTAMMINESAGFNSSEPHCHMHRQTCKPQSLCICAQPVTKL